MKQTSTNNMMHNLNTIGVIGSQLIDSNAFATELGERREGLIKIYEEKKKTNVDKSQLPFTKVVDSVKEIIEDGSIHTVFISRQELRFISPALQAGKSVRVIW